VKGKKHSLIFRSVDFQLNLLSIRTNIQMEKKQQKSKPSPIFDLFYSDKFIDEEEQEKKMCCSFI